MPWLKNGPTGEGYCRYCNFLVGTWRRKLITHAGYWEYYKAGAAKYNNDKPVSTALVQWCKGSGKPPSPLPENPIDPYIWSGGK